MDVYCPWDVMNYVLDLQRKPDAKPLSYWKNTSDNAIIRSFIDSLPMNEDNHMSDFHQPAALYILRKEASQAFE